MKIRLYRSKLSANERQYTKKKLINVQKEGERVSN